MHNHRQCLQSLTEATKALQSGDVKTGRSAIGRAMNALKPQKADPGTAKLASRFKRPPK